MTKGFKSDLDYELEVMLTRAKVSPYGISVAAPNAHVALSAIERFIKDNADFQNIEPRLKHSLDFGIELLLLRKDVRQNLEGLKSNATHPEKSDIGSSTVASNNDPPL